MCGIAGFGLYQDVERDGATIQQIRSFYKFLLMETQDRGKHATGLAILKKNSDYAIWKKDVEAEDAVLETGFHEVTNQIDNDTVHVMGHCRWATHGAAKDNVNNHPVETHGEIVGVHNGVLSNDDEVFDVLGKKHRIGEVDSEAIFATIEKIWSEEGGTDKPGDEKRKFLFETTRDTSKVIEGSFAISVMCRSMPEYITLARNDGGGKTLSLCKIPAWGILVYASEEKHIFNAVRNTINQWIFLTGEQLKVNCYMDEVPELSVYSISLKEMGNANLYTAEIETWKSEVDTLASYRSNYSGYSGNGYNSGSGSEFWQNRNYCNGGNSGLLPGSINGNAGSSGTAGTSGGNTGTSGNTNNVGTSSSRTVHFADLKPVVVEKEKKLIITPAEKYNRGLTNMAINALRVRRIAKDTLIEKFRGDVYGRGEEATAYSEIVLALRHAESLSYVQGFVDGHYWGAHKKYVVWGSGDDKITLINTAGKNELPNVSALGLKDAQAKYKINNDSLLELMAMDEIIGILPESSGDVVVGSVSFCEDCGFADAKAEECPHCGKKMKSSIVGEDLALAYEADNH